ncbi:DsbA family protein [Shewanella algae]|uniref:DsbA family protein n=1 Tax=Shewanella algae TaxID=38313 RepID=UPI0006D27CFA|nr:DsbA family protein [Shewanella algae]MBC8797188.1 DsbA family protein [Shewanella algae]MBO2688225.1 DsbA family protein [Shewanella algae]MCE9773397.1 DsbA family protein [Shewanella algae]PSS74264.1 hypothetical protein AYI88_00340 [Shewanella algae]
MVRLHYFFDPLCGWCHGAAPLIHALSARLPIVLHAGGLMEATRVTPGLRQHILSHDSKIAKLTGQPFGDDYTQGLLQCPDAVLDSGPAIAAILLAEKAVGQGLALLEILQRGHYVQGLRLAEPEVLLQLLKELPSLQALGREKLASDLTAVMEANSAGQISPLASHIAQSRAMMAKLGLAGFPSLVLESEIGEWHPVPLNRFYGQTEAMLGWFDSSFARQLSGIDAKRDNPKAAPSAPAACILGGGCD